MNRAGAGEGAEAGRCRYCGCTELEPCRLEDGEACCWLDSTRTVCSAPACIVRERGRIARCLARTMRTRRTPAEVHEQIMREAREKRRRARKRRAA